MYNFYVSVSSFQLPVTSYQKEDSFLNWPLVTGDW